MSPERRTPFGVEFWDKKLGVKKSLHPLNYHFREPQRYERVTALGRPATIVGEEKPILNHFGYDVPPKGRKLVVFERDSHVTGIHETFIERDN